MKLNKAMVGDTHFIGCGCTGVQMNENPAPESMFSIKLGVPSYRLFKITKNNIMKDYEK